MKSNSKSSQRRADQADALGSVFDEPQPWAIPPAPELPPRADDRFVLAKRRRLSAMLNELSKRQCDHLSLYEPLAKAEEFHKDNTPEVILIAGHRAGKSQAVMTEIARAVSGRDPYKKYRERDGVCYLVGISERELAGVFYKKLFRSDPMICMVRDPETTLWRSVRPWEEWDNANRSLWRPMPPLIPPRMIQEVAWANKAKRVPRMVRLTTGWELHFFTAGSTSPRGVAIDIGVFDEEVTSQLWYEEIAARLTDRRGRFLWSTTPQAGSEPLLNLYLRTLKDPEGKHVKMFKFHMDDNPYVGEEEKERLKQKYRGNELAWKVRIEGEFASLSIRIFGELDCRGPHGVDPFTIPPTWTRYATIDPGNDVCCILFSAKPPPDDPFGDHLVFYDELYLHNCNADVFASALKKKMNGANFEDFYIDHQMGRQTEIGTGKTVEQQYIESMRRLRIRCNRRGTDFTWGSNDPNGRIEATKLKLQIRECGTPYIKVFRNTLHNFEAEVMRYQWKKNAQGYVIEKPAASHKYHAMDTFTMTVAADPQYVPPKKGDAPLTPGQKMHEKIKELDKQYEKHYGRTTRSGGVRLGI